MASSTRKRIAKNTLILYIRMLLVTGVSLYTVRVVLNTLGINDYGVYSAVSGLVALCVFLPNSMASATQRFFSFALGQNDKDRLIKTFTVNLVLYLGIAVLALFLLEVVGLWYISSTLKIPEGRLDSAIYLYHLSTLTLVASIITAPFIAILIAHEDMQLYAYAAIGDAILKLVTVFLLAQAAGDKLIFYGWLLFFVSVANAVFYISVCVWRYEECRFKRFFWDSKLLYEVIGFTGWTLFGQMSTIARNQAVTVLLNQTFTPAVVAARAIAMNIASQINMFSGNFNTSLYPPIIKSYASGDRQEMYALIFMGSRMTFFLLWIFALPLLLEMEIVLELWLKNPPPDTALFARLAMIETIIMSISLPLATAARAPGRMALYELTLGTIQFAILLISWFALNIGGPAYSVFIIAIVASVFMFFIRLIIVNKLTGVPVKGYLKSVLAPVLGVAVVSSGLSFFVDIILLDDLFFGFVTAALSFVISAICIYFIGLDRVWRIKIKSFISDKLRLRSL